MHSLSMAVYKPVVYLWTSCGWFCVRIFSVYKAAICTQFLPISSALLYTPSSGVFNLLRTAFSTLSTSPTTTTSFLHKNIIIVGWGLEVS